MIAKTKIIACVAVGLIAAAALLRLLPSRAGADYGTSLSVSPQQQVVNVGDNVDVTVELSTEQTAVGVQVGLDYDPAILEPIYSVPLPPAPTPTPSAGWPVSYTEGNFLKDWAASVGGTTYVSPKPKANQPGHITLCGVSVQVQPPNTQGIAGSGDIVTFHLRAIGNGVSPIHLASDGSPATAVLVFLGNDTGTNPPPVTPVLHDGEVFVGITPTPTPIPTDTPGPSATPTATPVSSNTPLPTATATVLANTHLKISPATQNAAIGATVDVAVVIDTDVKTRAASFELDYNKQYLTYTGVTEGNFYKDWANANGGDTVVTPPTADSSGHLKGFGISIAKNEASPTPPPTPTPAQWVHFDGPAGTGTIVTFHFTAAATGTSSIQLVSANVQDACAWPPLSPTNVCSNIPMNSPEGGTVVVGNSTVTPTPAPTTQGTGTPAAGVPSNSTVAISPATATVPPGAAFDVSVTLTTDANIRGVQGKLAFDPTLLEVDSVSEGSFLKDWASAHGDSTMVFPQGQVDNTAGTVSDTGISMMGTNAGGPTGSGTLFTYHMKAKSSEGTATLTLSDIVLSNENAATLSGVTVNGGQVIVQIGAPVPTATPGSAGGGGVSAQTSGSGGGSTGGGGGGGRTSGSTSGSSATPTSQVAGASANAWTIDLSGSISADGMVKKDIQWFSPDGKVRLEISAGTAALDNNGDPVKSIQVSQESSPESAPGDWSAISSAFTFQPIGATFNPPISLTFQYDPSLMPQEVENSVLKLAYFDTKATPPAWQKLNTVVDPIAHTVSAKISHFSVFGAFANPKSGLPVNLWVLGGTLGGEALLGAAAYWLIQARRRRRVVRVKSA